MVRTTSYDDVNFPVDVVPAGAFVRGPLGGPFVRAPSSRAIIDTRDQRIVGIVGAGYRLVTNHQAIDWAFRCAAAAFPQTRSEDWIVAGADGPSSGGSCTVDVQHRHEVLGFATGPTQTHVLELLGFWRSALEMVHEATAGAAAVDPQGEIH